MNRPLFLFIDESGDVGDNDGTGGNTIYYSELAIQTEYGRSSPLVEHITKWRYEEGISGEPKHIPKDEEKCKKFLEPIIKLHQTGVIEFSAVYLRKDKYTGPYLKTDSPFRNNRLWFRNFVHKQLLEHHFSLHPNAQDDYISAIFDYHRMSRPDFKNITNYLCNICEFGLDDIIHLDSVCSWMLQLAGQLAHATSQAKLGETPKSITDMLSFISVKDITNV